jgi:hypothetical protein
MPFPLILKAWEDLAMKQTETFTWYSHSADPDLIPIMCRYICKESSDKTRESKTRISSSHINTYINIPYTMENAQQNKCVKNIQSQRPLRNT